MSVYLISSSGSTYVFLTRNWRAGFERIKGFSLPGHHPPFTVNPDAEPAERVIQGERMTRRRFQRGSIYKRGKRKKVWVARCWEDVTDPDGTGARIRRSEILGYGRRNSNSAAGGAAFSRSAAPDQQRRISAPAQLGRFVTTPGELAGGSATHGEVLNQKALPVHGEGPSVPGVWGRAIAAHYS